MVWGIRDGNRKKGQEHGTHEANDREWGPRADPCLRGWGAGDGDRAYGRSPREKIGCFRFVLWIKERCIGEEELGGESAQGGTEESRAEPLACAARGSTEVTTEVPSECATKEPAKVTAEVPSGFAAQVSACLATGEPPIGKTQHAAQANDTEQDAAEPRNAEQDLTEQIDTKQIDTEQDHAEQDDAVTGIPVSSIAGPESITPHAGPLVDTAENDTGHTPEQRGHHAREAC